MDIGARDLAYPLAADLRNDLDAQQPLRLARPRSSDIAFDVSLDERIGDRLDTIGRRIGGPLRLPGRLLICCRVLAAAMSPRASWARLRAVARSSAG